jgi:hypothetical protein
LVRDPSSLQIPFLSLPIPGSYEPSYKSPRSDEPIERRLLKAQRPRRYPCSKALFTGPDDQSHVRKRGNSPDFKGIRTAPVWKHEYRCSSVCIGG